MAAFNIGRVPFVAVAAAGTMSFILPTLPTTLDVVRRVFQCPVASENTLSSSSPSDERTWNSIGWIAGTLWPDLIQHNVLGNTHAALKSFSFVMQRSMASVQSKMTSLAANQQHTNDDDNINDEGCTHETSSSMSSESAAPVFNMALAFERGIDGLPEDRAMARELYSEASKAGHAKSMYNLALLEFKEGHRSKKIANLFSSAADSGLPQAQTAFGLCLLNGVIVERDSDRAVTLLESAAKKGDPSAAYHLGQLAEGKGETGKAASFYRQAADSGHTAAKFSLATLHHFGGLDMARDVSAARKLYEEAAAAGSDDARFNLSLMQLNEKKTADISQQ